jgi:tetratricopeptide (TPR) repeat protein
LSNADAVQGTTVVAFHSYSDGVGRSSMVANVALIMASLGYRVLVVDLDLASPSLHRFLQPFLPRGSAAAPVGLNCRFLDQRASVDFLGPVTDAAVDRADYRVGRAGLAGLGYDYVLLDMPASPAAPADTAELADVLVLGYTLNKQVMDRALGYARAIRGTARGEAMRILPVPMSVDRNAAGQTPRMRAEGRRLFAWLLDDMPDQDSREYWNGVEVPYEPDYAVEEGLPFLDDSSDQRDRLVSAYRHLVTSLTHGLVPAERVAITDETRKRYRAARRAAAGGDSPVIVVHAPADRYWAEWLVAELRRLGLTADRRRIDNADPGAIRASSMLFVVSHHLLNHPRTEGFLAAAASVAPAGGQVPLAVSIDHSRLSVRQFPTLGHLDLAGKSAPSAQQELASYYGVSSGPGASAGNQGYYPGRRAPYLPSHLPARARAFRGRDDDIDRMRDHLTSAEGLARFAVTGPAGIGKSQLALEYAHRFAYAYDLVFFIRAENAQAVLAGLAELAAMIKPKSNGGEVCRAALRDLESGPEWQSWLLIYDGADDLDVLDGLTPEGGRGHIVLTSRTGTAEGSAQLAVEPLDATDSDAMLMDLVPGILPGDARAIAAAVHYVPLTLRLAAAWIGAAQKRLLKTGHDPATVTGNAAREFCDQVATAAAGPARLDPLTVSVGLLTRWLEDEELGNAALLLLETCAFLAPIGISRRLLRSPGMLEQLVRVDAGINDPAVLNNVLRLLDTYGFSLPSETSRGPLQIHPLVLEVLRGQLSPQQRARRRSAVTRMLAASVPLDIDDDVVIEYATVYSELLQHLGPSGALGELDFAVRRWLVNQVRYLWQTEMVSAWDTAAEIGEELASHWAAALPAGEDDELLLRLRTQLANVYRSRCEFQRALEMDADVLVRQKRVLGLSHIRTLMTARSYGADLRLRGDFDAAALEDQATRNLFAETLGDGHLMTIVASSNLALSQLLSGEPEQALERQRADLERCRRIVDERPTQEPWILFHIGTLLRELGRYEESRDRLSEAQVAFGDLVGRGVMSRSVWVVLRTDAGLAITERRLGHPNLERTELTLKECENTYGDRYPDVLALQLSKAGDLHALRRHQEAVAQAERTVQGYAAVFGRDHPFTRICQIDLSIYALSAGQPEIADEASRSGLQSLLDALGEQHLWSLAAAVARANVLVAMNQLSEARQLENRTLSGYRRRMGEHHPFTRIAGKNVALTRMLMNESDAIPGVEVDTGRRQAIELDAPPY